MKARQGYLDQKYSFHCWSWMRRHLTKRVPRRDRSIPKLPSYSDSQRVVERAIKQAKAEMRRPVEVP